MKRTKIVATLGPASSSSRTIKSLIQAGVDVFRLNFSHGTHSWLERKIDQIRNVSAKLHRPVAIIGDLQGPKIRIGEFKESQGIVLKMGREFTITTRNIKGDETRVSTSYKKLPRDVQPGDIILINDGIISLLVEKTTKTDVVCTVRNGGELSDHKGINLPGIQVSAPSLTKKDKVDLEFCLSHEIDFVALSFVRKANDVKSLRRRMKRHGKNIPIIAKIEKPEAIEEIDDIMKASDGIMIARGDLGVEMAPEDVPIIQKMLIQKAAEKHKLVITATQMLESMIHNPRPTRAEASDVANAIMDGTDAVMLSGETAIGKYPVRAARTMATIAYRAEQSQYVRKFQNYYDPEKVDITLAVASAACFSVHESSAKAIVVFTLGGTTALMVSKLRPKVPIIALTPNESTYRTLAMYWGVKPLHTEFSRSTDSLIRKGEKTIVKKKLLKKGDTITVIAGAMELPGSTNMMKVLKIE